MQCPVNVDEQQEYWSGKTKQHTVKNILLIDAQCRICWLSATYAGKWHDKTLVEDDVYALPLGSVVVQDRGFQGFVVPGMVMRQPTKKPRGGTLTAAQRAENAQIARERMRIEPTIGSVKRCRIVKDTIRYWQDRVRSMVMEIACGLHNLRLRFRPWHYDTDKSR